MSINMMAALLIRLGFSFVLLRNDSGFGNRMQQQFSVNFAKEGFGMVDRECGC